MQGLSLKEYVEGTFDAINFALSYQDRVDRIVSLIVDCFRNGNKLLICGNGGSAADSQHFAAELVGRFQLERKGLPCIALTTDTSILTAVGNDYGYDNIFARQVMALGKSGDILIAISTSGKSPNILNAVIEAGRIGMKTICLTGKDGGDLYNRSDLNINIPRVDICHIQEAHEVLLHYLAYRIENELRNSYFKELV